MQAGAAIYACYGSSTITTDQSHPSLTWNSNYAAVYHFPNSTNLSANDSTSNGANGAISGTSAASGKIGGTASFDGNLNYISVPTNNFPSGNNPLTFSAWVDWFGNGTNTDGNIMAYGNDNGTPDSPVLTIAGGYPYFQFGSGLGAASATSTINTGTWYFITADYTTTSTNVYVNGVLSGTTGYSSANITRARGTDSTDVGDIGGMFSVYGNVGSGSTHRYGTFYGNVDEMRVLSVALSPAWILTEYNNQSSPNTFYSIGTEL